MKNVINVSLFSLVVVIGRRVVAQNTKLYGFLKT